MPQSIITAERTSSESATFALSPLAAAISFALTAALTPLSAQAQETKSADASEPRQLSKLVAKDDDDIKVDNVASPKFTQPLLDTPQTITVVTQEVLRQQGAGTLMEALANTPGITMQLGENGNTSAGDTFSMRGSASQTNIFVDGIRDMGAITRDTFNIEQVEIAKGAVGADYGRGATAGYINLVSKLPQLDDFGTASLSADTGVSVRATSDLNTQLGNSSLRLNAMWQDGDVVGRDYVKNNRWGVAPGVAFGIDTSTRIYIYSLHTRGNNVPDGGIPSIGLAGFYNATLANAGIQPVAVDTSNFYGRYDDYEHTKANMGTVRIEHDFSDTFKLTNSTRYGKSSIERVLTGVNALTVSVSNSPDTWTVARTRQSIVQQNTLLTNQTNLNFSFKTSFVEHDVASGAEFVREQQYSPTYTGIGTLPDANLYHPNPYDNYTDTYARVRAPSYSDGKTVTSSAYVFDTLKLTQAWQLTLGTRLDHYDTDFIGISAPSTLTSYPTLPVGTLVPLDSSDSGNLLSWKAGVVYKPVSMGTIYLVYSNSSQPPGGTNFVLADARAANTSTNINRPGLDPQEARNLELGTKWDLFDARLALSLAAYRTENRNEVSITDTVTQEISAYGKRRVQGVEFGVVGKLTDNWSLIAGAAYSNNKVIEGSTGNNATGAAARWAPKYSANLWSTYVLGKFTGGFGLNYVDEQKRLVDPSVPVNTSAGVAAIPGYTVFNGMLAYAINDSVGVQVNVYNLFNKDYISSLNNGGSRLTIGKERYAQATINFKF